jgi:hypothetical protein
MIQRQRLRVTRYLVREKLERDESVQPRILGLVHHSHATAAQFAEDAVMGNCPANHWRESYVPETGKSMKAGRLAASQVDRWHNITIAFIEGGRDRQCNGHHDPPRRTEI